MPAGLVAVAGLLLLCSPGRVASPWVEVVHTRFEDSDLRSYQQTHQWPAAQLRLACSKAKQPNAFASKVLLKVAVNAVKLSSERLRVPRPETRDSGTERCAVSGESGNEPPCIHGISQISFSRSRRLLATLVHHLARCCKPSVPVLDTMHVQGAAATRIHVEACIQKVLVHVIVGKRLE